MATKPFAEQVNDTQVMVAALRNNIEKVSRRGLDENFINELETTHNLVVQFNDEQEKLKADLKTKTFQLMAKLEELNKKMSEARTTIKMEYDRTQWREFGISAKR